MQHGYHDATNTLAILSLANQLGFVLEGAYLCMVILWVSERCVPNDFTYWPLFSAFSTPQPQRYFIRYRKTDSPLLQIIVSPYWRLRGETEFTDACFDWSGWDLDHTGACRHWSVLPCLLEDLESRASLFSSLGDLYHLRRSYPRLVNTPNSLRLQGLVLHSSDLPVFDPKVQVLAQTYFGYRWVEVSATRPSALSIPIQPLVSSILTQMLESTFQAKVPQRNLDDFTSLWIRIRGTDVSLFLLKMVVGRS